jgi:hypothetical protein
MEDGSKPPRQKSVRTYLKEERKGRKKGRKKRRKEEKKEGREENKTSWIY